MPQPVKYSLCHGASANRKYFRMLFGLTHDGELNAGTGVKLQNSKLF